MTTSPVSSESTRRVNLTRRYLAALAITATLILVGAAIVDRALRELGTDARVINLAGRQRMLSQRIAKAALTAARASTQADRRAAQDELVDAAAQLRRNRSALLGGDTTFRVQGALNVRARALVVANQLSFDSLFAAAQAVAAASSPAETQIGVTAILSVEPRYLASTDSVTSVLTAEAGRRVREARTRMYIVVGLVLIGLVAVGVVVLRPAVQGIRASVGELRRANADLDLARVEAEDAARMKSEFLATMSHELRTPLNAVIGLSGLLADTSLDERQRVFVSTINHSGEALLDLINNVLDFSKIDAGKLEFETIDFDLHELVETSAETLALRAEGRGVELATFVAPAVPVAVRGDPGRIRQVLMNLLGNALKFTERGAVVVRVRTAVAGRLRFEVTDTGIGIPADKIDRLFKPFSQVDASTTRQFGGTGLGLDISRRLVELMQGTIGVESTPGVGSIFHFELPLGAAAVAPNADDTGALTGRRVLLVDDTDANRLLLREIVSGWGMRPVDVATPGAALDALREAAGRGAPFDIALLDWQMPGMDGYALAAEIRRTAAISRTPLILLSSFTHQGDRDEMAAAGFRATLAKPVRQRPLLSALKTALEPAAWTGSGTPGTAAGPRAARWPGRRVLVADDNPVNVLVLKAMLEQHGVQADVAADGVEVLEAVKRAPYDLILMDVYMPRLDGLGATRALRSAERSRGTHRTTVIAVTASVTQDDRAACLAAEMDDYVSKPVARDVLAGTLDRWFSPPGS